MTGADIAAIVNAAAMTAIKEHVRQKGDKLEISMRHFETALEKVKRKKNSADDDNKARDLQSFPMSGSLA